MKKYLLSLLYVFLGYSAIYASFPVTQNDAIEIVVVDNKAPEIPVITESRFANWSLVLGLLWMPLILAGAIIAWGGIEALAIIMIVAGIASFIGAIITGLISLFNEKTGRWKVFVGLGLTLGLLLISILSSVFEGGTDVFY